MRFTLLVVRFCEYGRPSVVAEAGMAVHVAWMLGAWRPVCTPRTNWNAALNTTSSGSVYEPSSLRSGRYLRSWWHAFSPSGNTSATSVGVGAAVMISDTMPAFTRL